MALRPQLADPWAVKRQPQPSPQMCELVSYVLLGCIALWSQIAFLSPPHHPANVLGTRKEIYCNSTAPIHALGIHMVLLCRRYITKHQIRPKPIMEHKMVCEVFPTVYASGSSCVNLDLTRCTSQRSCITLPEK